MPIDAHRTLNTWQELLNYYSVSSGLEFKEKFLDYYGLAPGAIAANGHLFQDVSLLTPFEDIRVVFFAPVHELFGLEGRPIKSPNFVFPFSLDDLDLFLDEINQDATGVWIQDSSDKTLPGSIFNQGPQADRGE